MKTTGSASNEHRASSESFEQSFGSLQDVVRRLSDGNLTLQEALASFERGMALADNCAAMLEEAELRVKQVSERAMRAGNASAREAAATITALDIEGPELAAFEIKTFESIVFETLDSKGAERSSDLDLDMGRGSGARPSSQSQAGRSSSASSGKGKPPVSRTLSILDPLFDEDD